MLKYDLKQKNKLKTQNPKLTKATAKPPQNPSMI